jgi:hypothetical protein
MSSESNFVEITDFTKTKRFIQKSYIVEFYWSETKNEGYIITVFGNDKKHILDKEEYEKFYKKMDVNNPKARKVPNHLLTS